MNKHVRDLLDKNRAAAKAAAESAAAVKAAAEAVGETACEAAAEADKKAAAESANENPGEVTSQDSTGEAASAASLSSPSTAKPVEGLEGGSNGGTPPLPAASGRETGGVAGEDKGTTGNPVAPKAAKASKQSGKTVQVRLRLPRDFAEMLMAFKPEKRAVALWLSLEGRIGSAWNLPRLAESTDQLRRVGVLLNQALRYLGQGGEDTDRLLAAVNLAMRDIKKLRPPNYEEGIPELTDGKTSGPKETTHQSPAENSSSGSSSQGTENASGKAGEG